MKSFKALLASSLILGLALTGCGDKENGGNQDDLQNNSDSLYSDQDYYSPYDEAGSDEFNDDSILNPEDEEEDSLFTDDDSNIESLYSSDDEESLLIDSTSDSDESSADSVDSADSSADSDENDSDLQ